MFPWHPVWVRGQALDVPAHLSSDHGKSTVCGHRYGHGDVIYPATGDADERCQPCMDILDRARAAVARRRKD
jgi:hypothetical protein